MSILINYDPVRLPEVKGAEIVSHHGQEIPLNLSKITFRAHNNESGQPVPIQDILTELQIPGKSLNGNHLDALLDSANRKLLPREWRKRINGELPHYFFWGTIYCEVREGQSFQFVRYLAPRNNSCWYAGKHYLSEYWYPFCRCAEIRICDGLSV